MDDDFTLITDADKQKVAYGTCVAGWAASGVITGSFLGNPLVGAAGGLVWALLTCDTLAPAFKRKLFSSFARMSEQEILAALGVIRRARPDISKDEAFHLLARARFEASRHPHKYANWT